MPQLSPPKTYPAYPSEQENTYVFPVVPYWHCSVLDPSTLDYELQIDAVPTFGSPNLRTYTKGSAGLVAFQEGQVAKAFVARLPPRSSAVERVCYWRARISTSRYVSDWTTVQQLRIASNDSVGLASSYHGALADSTVYSKEANSTTLYRLMRSLAQERDGVDFERKLTQADAYLGHTRDSRLADLFGSLVNYTRGSTLAAIDYRHQVFSLFEAFMTLAGVNQGIINTVVAFLAEPPSIIDVSSTPGWILGTNYLTDPSNPQLQPVAVLYSDLSKGFGWRLVIFNSWGLTYDQAVLEEWIFKIVPSHTKVTLTYAAAKNACAFFNHAIDWAQGTLNNVVVVGNSLQLSTGGLTGSWTSPVMDSLSAITSWKTVEADWTLSGQSVGLFIRYSSDGASFSAFENVTGSRAPTTLSQRYFQIQVTFTTTSLSYLPILNWIKFPYQRS